MNEEERRERKIQRHLSEVMERVKIIFDRYPGIKEHYSDTLLILLYYRMFERDEFLRVVGRIVKPQVLSWEDVPLDLIKRLTPPESIRRCRQKLWEMDEKYRPLNIEERRKKERAYRKVVKNLQVMEQLEF